MRKLIISGIICILFHENLFIQLVNTKNTHMQQLWKLIFLFCKYFHIFWHQKEDYPHFCGMYFDIT